MTRHLPTTPTKSALSSLLLLASCLSFACCGGPQPASRNARNATTETSRPESSAERAAEANVQPPRGSDPDGDNDAPGGHGRYDQDDASTIAFGHPASTADRTAIAALVRRFYADAAAGDGVKACSIVYSTYAEAIPEDYGTSPPGPTFARGSTCAQVLTAVFKHFHDQIAARLPMLHVVQVRTRERQGVAILRFGSLPEREVRVSREGKTWRVLALVDNPLP